MPVFNERGNLRRLYEEVSGVMRSLRDYDWEFVFVDDGSRDGSFEVVSALRAHDERVLAVRFPRNFGSHIAIAAGIDYCHGDAAIVAEKRSWVASPCARPAAMPGRGSTCERCAAAAIPTPANAAASSTQGETVSLMPRA